MNIVIVGGGFGGVKAALELAKNGAYRVTLVSDRDHLLFYPALYATATGRSRQQSVIPLKTLFHSTNVRVVHDTITGLDTQRKVVVGAKKQYSYDRLICALGVVTSYFGIKGLETYSYSIKSDHEIRRFKQHLHQTLTEDAHLDKNYVIVGAGPTGVELSAALATYLQRIARNHRVRNTTLRLSLIEAAPRVLPRMSEAASRLVAGRLETLGVRVLTRKKVEAEDGDSVRIDGREVPTKTVVWTSGVANHPFFAAHSDIFSMTANGRVTVNPQLYAAENIFVIGDNADTKYCGLAQTALHDAVFVVRVLEAERTRRTAPSYTPKIPVSIVPVGERWAIMEYRWLRLSGRPAALLRRLADLAAYLELFPVFEASKRWLSEVRYEEDCPLCK